MEILAGFGKRLVQGRDAADLKQRDVERLTEEVLGRPVDRGNISKYENEEQKPGMEILCALCYVTKTNPGWVMTGRGDPYWDLGESGEADAQKRLAKQLRTLADHLEGAAEAGIDMLGPIEVLSESEMEAVELTNGDEPGTQGTRHKEVS